MIKRYFPSAFLLSAEGRCGALGEESGCLISAVSKVQGRGVHGKQGACKEKAKTTVYVWSDHAFTNYSVPLGSGPASGAYRGSLL